MNQMISEFQPNPDGTDPADTVFELSGTPGESFTGWIVSIESDGSSDAGVIDRAAEVSGIFDSNGLLTVTVPDLENPSFTVALLDGFTGTVGVDLDTDNDGVADNLASLGDVIDAVGVADDPADLDFLFGAQLGGTDLAYTGSEPELVFRAGSTGDFFAVNSLTGGQPVFSAAGIDVTAGAFDADPSAGTTFGAINPALGSIGAADFTLQILHASDLEGGIDAIDNAPNFAAIVDALEQDAASRGIGSMTLSAGDNFIPGPFFSAGGDFSLSNTYEGFYNALFGLIDEDVLSAAADTNGDGFFDNDEIQAEIDATSLTFEDVYTRDVNGDGAADYFEEIDTSEGRLDMAIMNAIGFDAAAVGNHEFDAGTDIFENAINYDSEEGNSLSSGRYGNVNFLQEVDTPGIQFPYLTSNLDFSMDTDAGPLFQDNILPSTAFRSDLLSARADAADPGATDSDSNDQKIAPATTVEVNGTRIGVVGATTQLVQQLSSTGTIADISSPGVEDMAALAGVMQPHVDALIADGVNKIVVVSHLQQFALEQALAAELAGVDVIIAGGSDSISADATDRLRAGDTADQPYPVTVTNASGQPTVIVSTDGEYSYVGRLVIDFDADGNVIAGSVDPDLSGAYATDDAGIVEVWEDVTGASGLSAADVRAQSGPAADVEALTAEVTAIVTSLDGDVVGESAVYLNGERESVRTQETNLGNLTADANLAAARAVDPDVVVSLKNGGGIRASIGTIVDNGDGTSTRGVTAENPLSGKEAGEVSELDIDNVLRFDNGLVTVELTPLELKQILEHGVSATAEGATPGQFPQVGGLQFSFDPSAQAQVLGADGEPSTEGRRVQNVALIDADGAPTQAIIENGAVAAGAPASIKVVTLNFLAGGGDGYPFASYGAVTDLGMGEQQALAEYLTDNFPPVDGAMPGTGPDAFSEADTGFAGDTRIQNLAERSDTVGQVDNPAAPDGTSALSVSVVAEFAGEGGEGASEVVAHEDGKLYVTNGTLDRIDVFDLAAPAATPAQIDLAALDGYDGVQSVAVKNGLVAVAIARPALDETVFGADVTLSQPGFVAIFDTETLSLQGRLDVGNLPDQLTFNRDGTQIFVAGEGEKNEDSAHDDNPLGTVAIISVNRDDVSASDVDLVDFTRFNGLEEAARAAGIRIQEGVSFAEDAEPEYIALSADGATAFVALQENNAIARIDVASGEVLDTFSLGTVDFSQPGQEIDPNDDGEIEIRNFDDLVGMRMPDAIATVQIDGAGYIVTANEGDSRGTDEARVEDLIEDGRIDPSVDTSGLERLEVSTIDGDTDGDGDIDVLHSFSSRSFSIFDESGNVIYDSGSEFEAIIARLAPARFNDDDGDDGEDRSDAKGPEPEAVTTGQIGEATYAFIGLERDSGIMIYDISAPAEASFVSYIEPIFVDAVDGDTVARHGPEVITFIAADESLTGHAQIAVSYEISGSTVVYDLAEASALTPVYDIQGGGHVSAMAGEEVTTSGVVTAVDYNGYYLQDEEGDGDTATSDAMFVFTGNGNTGEIAVGDKVEVGGVVSEYIPGGAGTGNLSITQIEQDTVEILSSGNDLPLATLLGAEGRTPPTEVIISGDEIPVNLQDVPGSFNPDVDGIDFYESLEAMRVEVADPVAISATNRFDETWVVADDGAGVTSGAPSGGLTPRGTLMINADADGYGDLNPERIQLQYDAYFDLLPDGFEPPAIEVGDDLGNVTGVMSYSYGNYEVLVTETFEIEAASANTGEETELTTPDDDAAAGGLTVATYNVLNLTANYDSGDSDDDDAAQMAAIGAQIAGNLGSPDIVALQEIQDDSGVNGNADDGVLSADGTLQALVDAIAAAGGPAYAFASAEVDVFGETGGVPGGNIRNAFLWNPVRVTAQEIVTLETEELTAFGVSDPEAFNDAEARDPLLGRFGFGSEEITLINNHWESRSGSDPIFGGPQPFEQGGEAARAAQALAINEVVNALVSATPQAKVAVLGDLNTFEFTDEVNEILSGTGTDKVLTNLSERAGEGDAYSYNYQGNGQNLDHILASDALLEGAEVDYVHVNADFADGVSDHEPIVARFDLDPTPPAGMRIVGTKRPDDLQGSAGDDTILGLNGKDSIEGGAGDDVILGGLAADRIDGGAGDDQIFGGYGADDLRGSTGDDVLAGGYGRDSLDGGIGDDFLIGGFGHDRFIFRADFGNDTISALGRRDVVLLQSGIGEAETFEQFVDATSQDGANLVYDFGMDGVNRITFNDMAADDLNRFNFDTFEFNML